MNTIEQLKTNSPLHTFDTSNPIAKKNTLYATLLTFVFMIVEIVSGAYYNSMALLADGWHMGSHVLALGLAYVTYTLSNKYSNDFRLNFGTYKIEVLGGYTSAILLLIVALTMAYISMQRVLYPVDIAYKEAIAVAILGLTVNLICAWLLRDDHHHDHEHHDHHHEHHHDLNLQSAYVHVLTDALTSVLAIFALIGGLLWGADWLDPIMGIVGSILVFAWAIKLLKQSGKILIDATLDEPIVQEVIDIINSLEKEIEIKDLHIWKVGKGKYGCILAISSMERLDISLIKQKLAIHEELVHITVEIL